MTAALKKRAGEVDKHSLIHLYVGACFFMTLLSGIKKLPDNGQGATLH